MKKIKIENFKEKGRWLKTKEMRKTWVKEKEGSAPPFFPTDALCGWTWEKKCAARLQRFTSLDGFVDPQMLANFPLSISYQLFDVRAFFSILFFLIILEMNVLGFFLVFVLDFSVKCYAQSNSSLLFSVLEGE